MQLAKKLFLFSFLVLSAIGFSAASANAGELAREDSELVKKRAEAFTEAFDKGDANAYVEMLHTSIFQLVPNREQLVYGLKKGMESVRASEEKVESTELEAPTEFYVAGDEIVCFVVRKKIIRDRGQRSLNMGYLLAARKANGPGQWLFLDSDGFRNEEQLIFRMLPALPKDTKIPPILALRIG
jgi:hypothetical protein